MHMEIAINKFWLPFVASRATHGNRKIGRQMAIKSPVSSDFYLRLSGVKLLKYLKDIQLIFMASWQMSRDMCFQQCNILTWIDSDEPV